jgi:ElaB/YqjD/DUF883 family membrane-anchored ribosome-binding protein
MATKKKTVDEAIEEVAEKATGGLTGVKDSLAKAQQSMESARSAMQDAYGKAKDTAVVYLAEAKEKMGGVAAKSRDQADVLYAKTKEQYDVLSVKAKDAYGKAKTKVAEVDFKQKGDEVVEYVRTNPGKAILIALAVGFLVGYATRPRD